MNRDRVPSRPSRRVTGQQNALARDRKANAEDREAALYARKRFLQARKRAAMERREFDPSPPNDDTWTVGDEETDGVRKLTPPAALHDAISTLIEARGWREPLRTTAIWSQWEEIVGSELVDRCEPVRLTAGTLTIRAETQIWATQLRYLVGPLRTRCSEILGTPMVKHITIVVGPLTRKE